MRKMAIVSFAISAALLAGCTQDDVAGGIRTACGFAAPAKLITGVVTDITGKPPLAGIAIDVAQAAIDGICAAYNKKQASGGRAFVLVESRNAQTGVVTLRTLSGNLVGRR